ncbi:MAG: hypothetical protein AB1716_06795 [Planctomycetota bacterium]
MGEPLGFFLTWRTYGTWLHGDPRGSIDRAHNAYATPWLDANPAREQWEAARLKTPPVELDAECRRIAERAIRDHCTFRGWPLRAVQVRSNHAHVVVGYSELAPERMMLELKGLATRRLREAGRFAATAPVWAERGSRKYLWDEKSVAAAVAYVLEGQDTPR